MTDPFDDDPGGSGPDHDADDHADPQPQGVTAGELDQSDADADIDAFSDLADSDADNDHGFQDDGYDGYDGYDVQHPHDGDDLSDDDGLTWVDDEPTAATDDAATLTGAHHLWAGALGIGAADPLGSAIPAPIWTEQLEDVDASSPADADWESWVADVGHTPESWIRPDLVDVSVDGATAGADHSDSVVLLWHRLADGAPIPTSADGTVDIAAALRRLEGAAATPSMRAVIAAATRSWSDPA